MMRNEKRLISMQNIPLLIGAPHSLGAGLQARRKMKKQESGFIMIVALVVLTVMTLAGLAMLRTSMTGQSVAGNLAFKKNATSVADSAVNEAIAFLTDIGKDRDFYEKSSEVPGYFAKWPENFDPKKFNWDAESIKSADFMGNSARYVIHRMCSEEGSVNKTGQNCVIAPEQLCGGGTPGSISTCNARPMYRIDVQVLGVRNTKSYIQVMTY